MTEFDDSDLWATDVLLDSLASGASVDGDFALELMAALVDDVSADMPDLVVAPDPRVLSDLRVFANLLEPSVPARRQRRFPRLAPRTSVAGAAVMVVLSTGGMAAASVQAGPMSPLFPLHRVLTGQGQLDASQRQALEIRDRLRSADRALQAGKIDQARREARAVALRLPKVRARDGRHQLAEQWTALNRRMTVPSTVQSAVVAPVSPTSHLLPATAPTGPAVARPHQRQAGGAVPPVVAVPALPTPAATPVAGPTAQATPTSGSSAPAEPVTGGSGGGGALGSVPPTTAPEPSPAPTTTPEPSAAPTTTADPSPAPTTTADPSAAPTSAAESSAAPTSAAPTSAPEPSAAPSSEAPTAG